ncbi:MAG: MFS transporter, partial [Microbacteriaceae bacterium]|nr:MFS transporter [Burkholderiaceae bacterium]
VALGWQMYDLTGSAWDLGLVGLAQFLPALLLALPAGHTIDRHDRRRVLALVLALQAVVAAALAIASGADGLGRGGLLAVSVGLGALRAFQMPASQALLPQLGPFERLPQALALSATALQGAIIGGPALGGALYALAPALLAAVSGATAASGVVGSSAIPQAGAALVYAVCALGFALALAAVLRLQPRPVTGLREPMSISSLAAGLRFIAERPVVLGAVSLDLFAVLLGGATALLPIFARDILLTGPVGLGLLRAAPAVGALAMSLLLARWPVQRRSGAWLLGAVAVYGVTMVGFGLSRQLGWSMALLALSGAADMVSVVIRQSLVQLATPDAMRGRVSAVNGVFIGASNQLGEFESGATAALFGPVASVVVGGIGTVAVVLVWARWFPALARHDRLVRSGDDEGARV